MTLRLKYYLLGFVLCNLFDAGCTLLLLNLSPRIYEGNVLLNGALHYGVIPFLMVKFLIIALVTAMIFYIAGKKPVAALTITKFGAGIYVFIVGYEIALMGLLLADVL
jgi:hypothetical protein